MAYCTGCFGFEWAVFGSLNTGDTAHLGVSWNRGTPKSSVSIGFSLFFHYKPSILGYPHLWNPPFNSLLCKITILKMRFSSSHQAKWAMAFIVVFVRIPAGKSHFISMAGHFTITDWWFGIWLSIQLGRMIPTDELIFFRGVGIPPTRISSNPINPWIPWNGYMKTKWWHENGESVESVNP